LRIFAFLESVDDLSGQTDARGPDVEEESPKTVLQCGRVFQVKQKYISDNDDGVEVEEALHGESVSEDNVNVAEKRRKRPQHIAKHCRNLDESVPKDSEPNDGRNELVDQSSVVIVFLKPDDAVQHRSCDAHSHY